MRRRMMMAQMVQAQSKSLRVTANSGSMCSTPHKTANPFAAGTIDIRLCFTPNNVTADDQYIVRKWGNIGDRQFILGISSDKPKFLSTNNGGTVLARTASVSPGIVAGKRSWVRVTHDGSSVRHYGSEDGVVWSQLGDAVVTQNIYTTTRPINLTGLQDGTGSPFAGKIHLVQIYETIDGSTPAFDFDPNTYSSGSTLLGRTGETWTLTGDASIGVD